MPITSHSMIGPMEQVWSWGWLISKLLSQRPSAFTLVGTWVLAVPALLGLLGIPFTVVGAAGTDDFGNVLVAGIPALLYSFCYVLLAGRVTLSYFRHRGDPQLSSTARQQDQH
jgi:hypothetical protein